MNNIGNTALITAAGQGHLGVVRFLLQKGANRDQGQLEKIAKGEALKTWIKRSEDWKRIHYVCDGRLGTKRLLKLFYKGVNFNERSKKGETPLYICKLTDPNQGALREDKSMTKIVELVLIFEEVMLLLLILHRNQYNLNKPTIKHIVSYLSPFDRFVL